MSLADVVVFPRETGAGHPWKPVVEEVSHQPHLCPVLSVSVPVAEHLRLGAASPTHVCSMGPLNTTLKKERKPIVFLHICQSPEASES